MDGDQSSDFRGHCVWSEITTSRRIEAGTVVRWDVDDGETWVVAQQPAAGEWYEEFAARFQQVIWMTHAFVPFWEKIRWRSRRRRCHKKSPWTTKIVILLSLVHPVVPRSFAVGGGGVEKERNGIKTTKLLFAWWWRSFDENDDFTNGNHKERGIISWKLSLGR